MPIAFDRLDHIALTVRDVDRSIAWYAEVLGFERRHAGEWGDVPAMLFAGDDSIALFPAEDDDPVLDSPTVVDHVALRLGADAFARAPAELDRLGVAFERADHVIALSLYIRDPDGHRIELTTYER